MFSVFRENYPGREDLDAFNRPENNAVKAMVQHFFHDSSHPPQL